MRKSVVISIIAAVGSIVVVGGLVLTNPAEVTLTESQNPHELLRDPLLVGEGAWRVVGGAANGGFEVVRTGSDATAPSFARVRGTIRQEVPLTPENNRAYRFAMRIRATSPKAPTVILRAQTACATNEEIAETTVQTTEKWELRSVTLTPRRGEKCSLRVEIVAPDNTSVDLSTASFVDSELTNPSFENGADGWAVTDRSKDAALDKTPLPAAPDGAHVVTITAQETPVTIFQEVPLDQSSEAVRATFGFIARSMKGRVEAQARVYEPCSDRVTSKPITISETWSSVAVVQKRLGDADDGLAIEAPDLIRPEGPPCVLRVELLINPGSVVQLDGAFVDLRSYNSAAGSARYQKAVKAIRDKELEAQEDAGEPTRNTATPQR
jgi:hypothetical protein